jgi:hypothetical protein
LDRFITADGGRADDFDEFVCVIGQEFLPC